MSTPHDRTAEERAAWSSFRDDLAPSAPYVGPFAHAAFLEASEVAGGTGELSILSSDSGAAAFVSEAASLRFAGPAWITDYHAPLGDIGTDLDDYLRPRSGSAFRWDSLPREAVEPLVAALDRIGARYEVEVHAATGVLDLPATGDEWLQSLGKKDRHEVRRKRRRYGEAVGAIEITSSGASALGRFGDLHRTAPGAKGSFMTPDMEAYFGTLLREAGAIIHELVDQGRTVAAAFGFETADAYYYYNSAFDADARSLSPGIVLISELIDRQIRRGAVVFDFLKGAESYKYRLGAQPRDLYVIEGEL